MKALVTVFASLEAVDAFLTMWAVNHGFTEANPLLAPVAGTWVSPVVKILPAVAAGVLLARLSARWPRIRNVANVGLVLCIAFMTSILASNLLEM